MQRVRAGKQKAVQVDILSGSQQSIRRMPVHPKPGYKALSAAGLTWHKKRYGLAVVFFSLNRYLLFLRYFFKHNFFAFCSEIPIFALLKTAFAAGQPYEQVSSLQPA